MEMIPVDVCYIDRIRHKIFDELARNRWIVPPRPPVAASEKPRVGKQSFVAASDKKCGMREDLKKHKR